MHDTIRQSGGEAINQRAGHRPLVTTTGGLVTYGKRRSLWWVVAVEAFVVLASLAWFLAGLSVIFHL